MITLKKEISLIWINQNTLYIRIRRLISSLFFIREINRSTNSKNFIFIFVCRLYSILDPSKSYLIFNFYSWLLLVANSQFFVFVLLGLFIRCRRWCGSSTQVWIHTIITTEMLISLTNILIWYKFKVRIMIWFWSTMTKHRFMQAYHSCHIWNLSLRDLDWKMLVVFLYTLKLV